MLDKIEQLQVMLNEQIQVLVDKQTEKKEYIGRIEELGDICIDNDISKQIKQAKKQILEYDNQLIPLYELLEDANSIAIQLKKRDKGQNNIDNWDDLVEHLNQPDIRKSENRWVSLFSDATAKVVEEMTSQLVLYPDGKELDYVMLTPESVLKRIEDEAENEKSTIN